MKRRCGAAALASAVLVLAGCSQVAALAPVGGDRLSEVRYAANDVLLDADVALMTAPVCTMSGDVSVTCTGETVDGRAIEVSSSADDPDALSVMVGGESVYDGSLDDVLEKASSG